MGHGYVAAEGCDEALVLGVCSSADESLMNSLMTIHELAPANESSPQLPSAVPGSATCSRAPFQALRGQ
jgi:hypothetical protein